MELTVETRRKLRDMGASDLLDALEAQDEGMCMGMTCAERVQMAVDEAHSAFVTSKVRNLTKRANLRYPEADVRSIVFSEERGLDRLLITELATCGFAERGQSVVLQGPTGTGKTYLACAIAKAACQRRMRACYIRCPDLEELWREARGRPRRRAEAHEEVRGLPGARARRVAARPPPTSCSAASCSSSWRPDTARRPPSSARSSARRTGTPGSGAASTPTPSWTASSTEPPGSAWAR